MLLNRNLIEKALSTWFNLSWLDLQRRNGSEIDLMKILTHETLQNH